MDKKGAKFNGDTFKAVRQAVLTRSTVDARDLKLIWGLPFYPKHIPNIISSYFYLNPNMHIRNIAK